MKLSLYFYLSVLFVLANGQTTYGQNVSREISRNSFSSGNWQVGLKDGYGGGNLLRHHNSFQAHSGYYLADKLLVGIGATWSKEWADDLSFNDLAVGPLVRYQFTRARLSPFIEASYQFGRRSSGTNSSINYPDLAMQYALINPGLSIRLLTPLWIDVSYGIQFTTIDSFSHTYNLPQLGLNYLFGH